MIANLRKLNYFPVKIVFSDLDYWSNTYICHKLSLSN